MTIHRNGLLLLLLLLKVRNSSENFTTHLSLMRLITRTFYLTMLKEFTYNLFLSWLPQQVSILPWNTNPLHRYLLVSEFTKTFLLYLFPLSSYIQSVSYPILDFKMKSMYLLTSKWSLLYLFPLTSYIQSVSYPILDFKMKNEGS